jgi:hypothetical protein
VAPDRRNERVWGKQPQGQVFSQSNIRLHSEISSFSRRSAMTTWSKEFLSEFIEEFRDLPSLWKVQNKEYHNSDFKKKGYSIV